MVETKKQNDVEKAEDPLVWKERGNQAFKDSYWEEAVDYYTKAIKFGEKHKDLPVFYKNRAQCHLKLENWEKAESDCTKALVFGPQDPKALYRRCQALEKLERFEESYRDARGVLDADPTNKVIQPVLERLHAIVQERARQRAKTSTKVEQMFSIAFDIEQDMEKRKTAMSNCVVLSREKAGAEVMFKEGVLQRIGRLVKVEKNTEIILNAIRTITNLCKESLTRTRAVIAELGVMWFVKMLNSDEEERTSAAQFCMQTVLNSYR